MLSQTLKQLRRQNRIITATLVLITQLLSVYQVYALDLTILFWGDRFAQSLPRTVTDSSGTYQVGGIGLLGGLVKAGRDFEPATLTFVVGGDLAGSGPAALNRGLSEVKALNKTGIDAYVPGLVDFGYGARQLLKTLKSADFPVVLANVVETNKGPLFKSDTILTYAGLRVAVTGLISPRMLEVAPRPRLDGIIVSDPLEAARSFVTTRRDSAEVLIALSQCGWTMDSLIAAQIEGIDLILACHNYPDNFQTFKVHRTVIARAENGFSRLSRAALTYDMARRTITDIRVDTLSISSKNAQSDFRLRKQAEFYDRQFTKKAKKQTGVLAVGWEVKPDAPGNFGFWTADALRSQAPSAHLGLVCNTHLGQSIPSGPLRRQDIIAAAPFEEPVIVFQMNGAELYRTIERQMNSETRFLSWSGLKLTAENGRIVKLMVGDYTVQDGDEYSVITTGRVWDNFTALTGLKSTERPRFQLSITVREVMFETVQIQRIIATGMDGRWEVK
ncbi:MAG: bifunctional metallophosphatase/5'-nucleotidase [Calditrichaeota bacterium]|nr:bifunctional metallophosphatase/5'-nucleotidase [Calditrichota bacterium]